METTKKHYVYLAGNISSDIRTYEWREEFEQLVEERNLNIVVLNPCRTKYNQELLCFLRRGGKNFTKRASQMPWNLLPGKDYQMVKISTLVVANFSLINSEKPPIGTVVEVNWARDAKTPVIAIVDESHPLGYLYSRHPFINWCIQERVQTVRESIDMVEQFFVHT